MAAPLLCRKTSTVVWLLRIPPDYGEVGASTILLFSPNVTDSQHQRQLNEHTNDSCVNDLKQFQHSAHTLKEI